MVQGSKRSDLMAFVLIASLVTTPFPLVAVQIPLWPAGHPPGSVTLQPNCRELFIRRSDLPSNRGSHADLSEMISRQVESYPTAYPFLPPFLLDHHHYSTEPLCTRDAKGWIHEKCSSSLLENKLVKEFLAHVRKSQFEAKRRMNSQ